MTQAWRSIAVVAACGLAVATPALAGGRESQQTVRLTAPERIVRHQQLAAEARGRGERELEAAHHIEACFHALYVHGAPTAPSCRAAEQAASSLPTTSLLARLRAYQSTFVAWTLDWTLARTLTDEAERLGAGGPAADTLEGEALRLIHLVRSAMDAEQGRYAEVAIELGRYIALSRTAGDRLGVAVGESFLCRHQRLLGRYHDALVACERGLVAARALGDEIPVASLLWSRGGVEAERGDLEAAAATWTEAHALAERMGIPLFDAAIRLDLAVSLVELGRLDAATEQLGFLQAGIDAGRLPRFFASQVSVGRGDLAAMRGDDRAAIAHYRGAMSSPITGVVIHAHLGEAGALQRLGELAGAETGYRAAIARIEAARATAPGDAPKAGYMQRHVHAYQGLVGVLWDRDGASAAVEALAVAEAARARALLDALRGAGLDTAIAPLDAAGLQAALPANTTLLLYVAAERALFGFAITTTQVSMVELVNAGSHAALAARVQLYRALLATTDDVDELAGPGAALYADLVAPLVGDTPRGTLMISADGALHLLPFDALYRSGRGFVVEHADVGYTPSGSLLARGATSAPRATAGAARVLTVASPRAAPPLPLLLGGHAEATAIGAAIAGPNVVLSAAQATESALRGSAPETFEVLHFATHAVIDDAVPLRSALSLAPGAGGVDDDGWLRAEEIYRWHLTAALVVLSACRSGDGLSSAEGPMSLARAFLHAGAGSVIATLWDVEDRRGPAMARLLYQRLGRGELVGAALAAAKRSLISAGAPPRAWAPWVAIGNPSVSPALAAAPTRGDRRLRQRAAWFLAAFGLIAVAGALVLGWRGQGAST